MGNGVTGKYLTVEVGRKKDVSSARVCGHVCGVDSPFVGNVPTYLRAPLPWVRA